MTEEGADAEKIEEFIHSIARQYHQVNELSKKCNGALEILLANAADANEGLTSEKESLKNKSRYLTPNQINNSKNLKENPEVWRSNGEDAGIK